MISSLSVCFGISGSNLSCDELDSLEETISERPECELYFVHSYEDTCQANKDSVLVIKNIDHFVNFPDTHLTLNSLKNFESALLTEGATNSEPVQILTAWGQGHLAEHIEMIVYVSRS